MSRALGAARANLVGHASYFTKRFQAFSDELNNTLQKYRGILEHCEEHFLQLQAVEIPETLKEQNGINGKNLLETEALKHMRDHQKHAAEGLSQMEARMTDLRSSFAKFAKKVEDSSTGKDESSIGGSHFKGLEEVLSQLVAIREKQYDSRKALGECGDDEARADELREEMRQTDATMVKKMMATLEAKSVLRISIHTRMAGISDLQTNIRKMGKTTNGYFDSLNSLDRYFVELSHVEHIASAFAASLEEVLRRKKFKLKYEKELAQPYPSSRRSATWKAP